MANSDQHLAVSDETDEEETKYPHGWWILPTIFVEIACGGLIALILYVTGH